MHTSADVSAEKVFVCVPFILWHCSKAGLNVFLSEIYLMITNIMDVKIFKIVLLMLQLSFSLASGSDDQPGASLTVSSLCFCRWVVKYRGWKKRPMKFLVLLLLHKYCILVKHWINGVWELLFARKGACKRAHRKPHLSVRLMKDAYLLDAGNLRTENV